MSFRKKVENSALLAADKPFLWSKGQIYTYADALDVKSQFSDLLGQFDHLAVISNSGDISYLSVFSAVILDVTFMHLNIDWHENRIMNILQLGTPDVVVCHKDWAASRAAMFEALNYGVVVNVENSGGIFESLTIYKKRHREEDKLAEYKMEKGVEDLLYVMFTSGSTGHPKGVPVDVKSAELYATAMVDTFNISEFESWLQPADLHFDLSMLTILTAWITCGYIISVPSTQSPFGPRFVKKFGIQNWTSVPSVIARSNALGLISENAMPSLKRSFFCGEALPSDIAGVWSDACPNGDVYNLYGPTEATVNLTWHTFDQSKDTDALVPIGQALPGSFVRISEDGEIELGGAQVFHGYLDNAKEISTYLETDDDGTRWYKTGDLGQLSPRGILNFRGRIDWQVKIRGYRVEIEGIEAAIRQSTGSSMAAVIPLDEVSQNSYNDLCAFVEPHIDIDRLKTDLAQLLPDYMVPQTIIGRNDFPKNTNGKIDRNALIKIAETRNTV